EEFHGPCLDLWFKVYHHSLSNSMSEIGNLPFFEVKTMTTVKQQAIFRPLQSPAAYWLHLQVVPKAANLLTSAQATFGMYYDVCIIPGPEDDASSDRLAPFIPPQFDRLTENWHGLKHLEIPTEGQQIPAKALPHPEPLAFGRKRENMPICFIGPESAEEKSSTILPTHECFKIR
ncbi:hypothetical protein STEG23_001252, partial [Scotinomys teguina]